MMILTAIFNNNAFVFDKQLYRIGLRIEELRGDIMARLKTEEAKNEEKL